MAMTKAPANITIANLEVVVMPNGEVICNGKTIGWVDTIGTYLTEKTSTAPVRTEARDSGAEGKE